MMKNSPVMSEEEQKQTDEANELALAFFDTIKKRERQKPFKALKTIPKKRFKANNAISLTIDEDQSIDFKFAGGVTHFRFAANTMVGLEPVKTFINDFVKTFKEKHPGETPFFELKAYSKESLDRTLLALQATGVKVNKLILVDETGKEQIIETPEQIKEYYSALKQPADKQKKKPS
ncbi:hypothetical protein CC99x_005575 [Candidatus Berkiella cookevillensis]|uniref:Uncharacterized protein n=2 Tax=Candidatus Berkiella cookevillensis TaxID=437022 RepID=A0AAE3HQ26_9GAMM|nr:hypothetical protein [Candidatus Berkiella cookevillensis]MCS5708372.1 hypothetical protein [Candidatus Berkiella cookevillensis]